MSSPLFLASDHAGFILKEAIAQHLRAQGREVIDFGTTSDAPVDYPDFILPAVERAVQESGQAIVFGGSGVGECVVANKVRGARAALAYDEYTARMSREHNNANVLCLGGRTVTGNTALATTLVDLWLSTPFSGDERHMRRLEKISAYETR